MSIFRLAIACLCLAPFLICHAEPQNQRNECVVLLCNKKYFPKFLKTVDQLLTKGKYHGDICLIIGNDLVGDDLLNSSVIVKNHIEVKHFPDLQFPDRFLEIARTFPLYNKIFQYHKLHLFNSFFKQWKTILYIDCGMNIYSDIRQIMETRQQNVLLAHSDAYPDYSWKLHGQFSKQDVDIYNKLSSKFNLDVDYFQTTMMLYDTDIIHDHTFEDLYNLAVEYPICLTNDQGVIALYFTGVVNVWKQIPIRNQETFFYDFHKRDANHKYVMVKSDPGKRGRFEKYWSRILRRLHLEP